MRIQFLGSCIAAISLIGSIASAAAPPGGVPDPADPVAATPVIRHESTFADYQPFREQKIRSWKEVNQEVADNPGMGAMGSMGSMKGMPGMPMSGMESKTGAASKSKEGAADHNMGSMKTMPGMDSKSGEASKSKQRHAGHDMGSMKNMPGMNKEAGAAPKKERHDAMAMAKPQTAHASAANAQTANVAATGVVQSIDKANGKVKLTHDPIAALGWPKMSMYFRLKNNALADQVREGDKVEFSLEKSASGYVISGFQKSAAGHDLKQVK